MMFVPINDLEETRGTRRLNAEKVQRYMRWLAHSAPPPLRVDVHLRVLDGHHRLAAAKRCGLQLIAVKGA